jgi:hypothetical protein
VLLAGFPVHPAPAAATCAVAASTAVVASVAASITTETWGGFDFLENLAVRLAP